MSEPIEIANIPTTGVVLDRVSLARTGPVAKVATWLAKPAPRTELSQP